MLASLRRFSHRINKMVESGQRGMMRILYRGGGFWHDGGEVLIKKNQRKRT